MNEDSFVNLGLVSLGLLVVSSIYAKRRNRRIYEEAKAREFERKWEELLHTLEHIDEHSKDASNVTLRKKRNEVFFSECDFRSYKFKASGKYNYHGPRLNLKITKGVSYKVGQVNVHSDKRWMDDGFGQVVISNQAISFITETSTKRWTLNSISSLKVHADGFELKPDRGAVILFKTTAWDRKVMITLALLLGESLNQDFLTTLHGNEPPCL